MNLFKKMTKKAVKPVTTEGEPSKFKLEFFANENETEYLHDMLGITEERASEMTKNALIALKAKQHTHLVIDRLVRDCHHENEIVFYVMIHNKIVEKHKKESTLLDLLSKLD